MLQPARRKYRKEQKGRNTGVATRGNSVAFGDFGLKCTDRGRLTARQIEAARRAISRHVKRGGRIWIRVFPDKPISQKPAEVRMGNGKGNPEYYVAEIQPGKVIYEIVGVPEAEFAAAARDADALYPRFIRADAALIGTLFAIAQLVASSEYTVMRVSGVSVPRMAFTLIQVGMLFSVLTLVTGEFVAPPAEQFAQQLRAKAITGVIAQEFRSGLWVKDERNFVNVAQVLPDSVLLGVKIFEFDKDLRLRKISLAQRGEYLSNNRWRLRDVVQTNFDDGKMDVSRIAEADWQSVIDPNLLSVLLVVPEHMSAWNLFSYVQHLKENNQQASRHEIAFWNKLLYPFAVLVMMVLALPFAYTQQRAGGVGAKVFAGNAARSESYVGYRNEGLLAKGETLKVGQNQYFAMGDNSANSADGRVWGFVPAKDVVGRPLAVYFPFTKHW